MATAVSAISSRDLAYSPAKPSVLIYADPLLAPCATFVRSQGEALNKFTAVYAGARAYRGGGLQLPSERTIAINRGGSEFGKLREIPFKVFGFDPFFLNRLRRLAPVLVHAHGGPSALAAVPIARRLKIPLIATFHGSDVTVDPRLAKNAHFTARAFWRRKHILQSEASVFIAVSRYLSRRLYEQGYAESKIVVHYVGADTRFFNPDPAVHREPTVLFVGTLHGVKGCHHLIGAMEKVQSEIPEASLVIIGDGPQRSELENLARRRLRRYEFLGAQSHQVVRHWMNRSKVLSVPSASDSSGATEAFGLVFIEAQAMGLPVASFLSGGISEAVEHMNTGLLADEGDAASLAENIVALLSDEVTWQRMSVAGRRRVLTHFDLDNQTRQLEDIYCRVLGEKH